MTDRVQLTPEQLAYFGAAATRQELLVVATATRDIGSLCAAAIADMLADDKKSAAKQVHSLEAPLEALAVLSREILNAGYDPEWDYRA